MSDFDKDSVPDAIGSRTQVAKKPKSVLFKDKLLLIGAISIIALIGISSIWPKHRINTFFEEDDKQDMAQALHQNMEFITKLKENSQLLHEGYRVNDPNHPPVLKTFYHDSNVRNFNFLTKETLARMNAPSTFFSASNGMDGREHTISLNAKGIQSKTLVGQDANAEFLNQQNDIASVSAKQLPHPKFTVPAGEMIPATLETAINSELAGMARAITSRNIYALSGNQLLIPKGTTLVGQFNSSINQGQSRVFVVWNRLQLTNGVIVTLNSPSTDPIGCSGQAADYIDRHFFERFGNGVLLSVLGAYTATGGVNGKDDYNSMAQYRMNIAGGFQQAANQTLQQDMQTKPTLQVNQGAAINIFVAHDLDFYKVANKI